MQFVVFAYNYRLDLHHLSVCDWWKYLNWFANRHFVNFGNYREVMNFRKNYVQLEEKSQTYEIMIIHRKTTDYKNRLHRCAPTIVMNYDSFSNAKWTLNCHLGVAFWYALLAVIVPIRFEYLRRIFFLIHFVSLAQSHKTRLFTCAVFHNILSGLYAEVLARRTRALSSGIPPLGHPSFDKSRRKRDIHRTKKNDLLNGPDRDCSPGSDPKIIHVVVVRREQTPVAFARDSTLIPFNELQFSLYLAAGQNAAR